MASEDDGSVVSPVDSSSYASSIPEVRELPGLSQDNPLFDLADGAESIEVTYSGERARSALREACGTHDAAYALLSKAIPDTYTYVEKSALHRAFFVGLIATLTSGGFLSLTDTVMVLPSSSTLVLTTAIAVCIVRYVEKQLFFYMDESNRTALQLHDELKRKLGSMSKGCDHNTLPFNNITNSFINFKTLYNRSVYDRESCVDNVFPKEYKVGNRTFNYREDSIT